MENPKKQNYLKALPQLRQPDPKFMSQAIKYAKLASRRGEVPVGAVIVKDGQIISFGYNRRESGRNSLLHAEIIAINRACKKLDGWRLSGCDLYVTLEPCPMCAGAIINSRIENVYFGASDAKSGAMGSVINMTDFQFNFKPFLHKGILQEECADLLKEFFQSLRKTQRKNKL